MRRSEGTPFDTEKYLTAQFNHINDRLAAAGDNPVYLEFGGKPFGDHHAQRVLPGYDADCKARLLSQLMPVGKIVMVVNAKDILLPDYGRTLQRRIRGDSGMFYDDETIRLVARARELGFDIKDVVLAISPRNPSDQDAEAIGRFSFALQKEGVQLHRHYEIDGYPSTSIFDDPASSFSQNDIIAETNKHLIVLSPGGGSGKFGVILSELYHSFQQEQNPSFMKFETFPVFSVAPDHALNLAFEVATADLQNRIVALTVPSETGDITTYDKDVENFALLRELFTRYGINEENTVAGMYAPTAMGVNRIMDGIIEEEGIIAACYEEIRRRIQRYQREIKEGIEKPTTLSRAIEVHDIFVRKYGGPLDTKKAS